MNSLSITVAEQSQPSFSYLSIAVLAYSVESCNALSYDTDSPLSNKLSMRSRLRVLFVDEQAEIHWIKFHGLDGALLLLNLLYFV